MERSDHWARYLTRTEPYSERTRRPAGLAVGLVILAVLGAAVVGAVYSLVKIGAM